MHAICSRTLTFGNMSASQILIAAAGEEGRLSASFSINFLLYLFSSAGNN